MIGIYCIENTINKKRYIGQSWDINVRILKHKNMLRTNTHDNRHMQLSYNKYGLDAFNFYVLRTFPDNALTQIFLDVFEERYISDYKLCDNRYGYNKRSGGAGGGKPTEETLLRMGEKLKGKAAWNKGIPRTPEEKKKMSIAKMGKHITEEHKQKISKKLKGRIFTEEHRMKISKAKLGKKHKRSAIE